ncbi:hypothetical protein [Streptomyces sp. NPDC055189]
MSHAVARAPPVAGPYGVDRWSVLGRPYVLMPGARAPPFDDS